MIIHQATYHFAMPWYLHRRRALAVAVVLWFGTMGLAWCGESVQAGSCQARYANDGRTKAIWDANGLELRFPAYVHVAQNPMSACRTTDIRANYFFLDGRLVQSTPETHGAIAAGRAPRVELYAFSNTRLARVSDFTPRADWRFEVAAPHASLPLIYYPKARWQDAAGPKDGSGKDGLWGVKGTRNPLDGKPYWTSCAIVASKTVGGQDQNADAQAHAAGAFANYGDSKCQGGVLLIGAEGKIVSITVNVWRAGAPQIDRIYQAVQREIEQFIWE